VAFDDLRTENTAFIDFHNTENRYAAHGGTSPAATWQGRLRNSLEQH
jgi:hypothetical protein